MLTDATTRAIVSRLIDADTTAEEAGWQQPPTLLILRDRPHPTDVGRREIGATALAVPTGDWYRHPHGVAGVLTDIADFLHRPDGAAQLARACPGDVRLIGWAVVYEDVLADDDTLVEVRRVEAVDTDGRLYLLERGHGDVHGLVAILDDPDPTGEAATHAPLAALVDAHQP